MIEPLLSVKKKSFRIHDEDGDGLLKNMDYVNVRPSVLSRDSFTCQCCGFESKGGSLSDDPASLQLSGYLEVHHLDDDHGNNDVSNLLTVCPFCHQVFHFGFAGHRDGGVLGYIPELTQAQVNNLFQIIGVTLYRDNELSSLAEKLNEFIIEQSTERLENLYGETASDPKVFVHAVLSMSESQYENRAEFLKGIRLIPNVSMQGPFSKHIAFWSKEVFPDDAQWQGITRDTLKKIKKSMRLK